MGRSKALLPCSSVPGDTFLTRIINSMRGGGVEDVLVIGRPDDAELMAAVLQPGVPARFVPNPHHDAGQITSIVAALNAIDRPDVRGLLVLPVDMPLVQASTFGALLDAFTAHPASIVRAVCGGRHGHPVIFDRGSFEALRRADTSLGAKAVLRAHADRIMEIEVPDEGVLRDFDSVEDYRRVFGRAPESGVQS